MQNYLPPEGFLLDENTGLYYQTQIILQENGESVQWVTWFNGQTGEYKQYTYPIDKDSEQAVENKEPESKEPENKEMGNNKEPQAEEFGFFYPPEGYIHDPKSDLFFQSQMGIDENGKQMEFVIWFDSKTGEYAQVGYPVSAELKKGQKTREQSVKRHIKTIKENRESQLPRFIALLIFVLLMVLAVLIWKMKWYEKLPFYKAKENASEVETVADTETLSNKETLTKKNNVGYTLAVNLIDSDTAIIRLTVPEIKNSYPAHVDGYEDNVILCDWGVNFQNYRVSYSDLQEHVEEDTEILTSEMMGALWKLENDSRSLVEGAELKTHVGTNAILWEVTLPENAGIDFSTITEYTVNIQVHSEDITEEIVFSAKEVITTEDLYHGFESEKIEETEEKNGTVETDYKLGWPDFPHVSEFYMLADEDENYMYMLQQDNPEWKQSGYLPTGEIYRLDKNVDSPQMEKIIALEGYVNAISAFTLMDEYIYYAVNYDNMLFGYFRIPKEGGESEFLFTSGYGNMQTYEGKIYILLRDTKELRIYDPQEGSQETILVNTDGLFDFQNAGAKSEIGLFSPFSIYQGYLYYGGIMDQNYYYGKMDLENQTVTSLASGFMEDLEFDDSGLNQVYGVSPFFVNDEIFTTGYGNNFNVRLGNDLIAYETGYEYMFQHIAQENNEIILEEMLDVSINTDIKAYAALENYILFYDKAVSIDNQTVGAEISLVNRVDLTEKWDAMAGLEDMAYELVDENMEEEIGNISDEELKKKIEEVASGSGE